MPNFITMTTILSTFLIPLVALLTSMLITEKLGWCKNGSKEMAKKVPYGFCGSVELEGKEASEALLGFMTGLFIGASLVLALAFLHPLVVIEFPNGKSFGMWSLTLFLLYFIPFCFYRFKRNKTKRAFNPWPQIDICSECKKSVYVWQRKIYEFAGIFKSAGGGHPFTVYLWQWFHKKCHEKKLAGHLINKTDYCPSDKKRQFNPLEEFKPSKFKKDAMKKLSDDDVPRLFHLFSECVNDLAAAQYGPCTRQAILHYKPLKDELENELQRRGIKTPQI